MASSVAKTLCGCGYLPCELEVHPNTPPHQGSAQPIFYHPRMMTPLTTTTTTTTTSPPHTSLTPPSSHTLIRRLSVRRTSCAQHCQRRLSLQLWSGGTDRCWRAGSTTAHQGSSSSSRVMLHRRLMPS